MPVRPHAPAQPDDVLTVKANLLASLFADSTLDLEAQRPRSPSADQQGWRVCKLAETTR